MSHLELIPARTAYCFYVKQQHIRARNENRDESEVGFCLRVKREWQTLSPHEKLPYVQMEAADAIRYRDESSERRRHTRLSQSHNTPAPAQARSAPINAQPMRTYNIECPMCREKNRVPEKQATVRNDNLGDCAVCFERPVEVFLPQCGHTCLCWTCVRQLNK